VVLSVLVTPSERERMFNAAADRAMSVSELVRTTLAGAGLLP
jgi:hypothetical protein